ncbi:hypothetical protein TNCV_3814391 [Trichonephila clavipes]|nr:hypothetical protein TNCV_3814391 [Trichonephila clavipes]
MPTPSLNTLAASRFHTVNEVVGYRNGKRRPDTDLKDALLDLSLEIGLAIPAAPKQDPQDIPQQLQLGEFMHYHPSR